MKYYYSEKEKIIYTGVMGAEDREATPEEVDNHFGTDIESLKKKKIEELKTIRNEKESGGFPYMGKVLDSDALSCQRMSMAAQSATTAILTKQAFPELLWSCADNSSLLLGAEGLAGIPSALSMFSAELHGIYGELKVQIEAATTKETLELIKWPEE